MTDKKGFFITLEGLDGAGKTTQIKNIQQYMKASGRNFVSTREPGGTDLGDSIRSLLLSKRKTEICPEAELLLFFAARKQHLSEVILPALSDGKDVLCDRFTDSSYAYQGALKGVESMKIKILERWTYEYLQPDLTLLFDVDCRLSLQRISKDRPLDRMEADTHKEDKKTIIRQSYLDRANQHQNRFVLIDASKHCDEVFDAVKHALAKKLLISPDK